MCMDLDIWFVTVCADGMNPGGCGGQDAGGPSEETKRKGEKKKKKKAKTLSKGAEAKVHKRTQKWLDPREREGHA